MIENKLVPVPQGTLKRQIAEIVELKAALGHSNVAVTNVYLEVQPGESSSTYLMEM